MIKRKKLTEKELARQNEIALADNTLNITADSVIFCRDMAAKYEEKAAEYADLAKSAPPAARGAYSSRKSQVSKARKAMLANAALQLEWLKRHRPEIYNEIK